MRWMFFPSDEGGGGGGPGTQPTFGTVTASPLESIDFSTATSVPYPNVVASAQKLYLTIMTRNTPFNSNVVTPAGWTLLLQASNTPMKLWVFVRNTLSVGNEGGTSLAVTITGTETDDVVHALIFTVTGVDGFGEEEDVTEQISNGTTVTSPSVTPGGINRLGLCVVALANNRATSNMTGGTGPSWTEQYEDQYVGGSTLQILTADMSAGTASSGHTQLLSSGNIIIAIGWALPPGDV